MVKQLLQGALVVFIGYSWLSGMQREQLEGVPEVQELRIDTTNISCHQEGDDVLEVTGPHSPMNRRNTKIQRQRVSFSDDNMLVDTLDPEQAPYRLCLAKGSCATRLNITSPLVGVVSAGESLSLTTIELDTCNLEGLVCWECPVLKSIKVVNAGRLRRIDITESPALREIELSGCCWDVLKAFLLSLVFKRVPGESEDLSYNVHLDIRGSSYDYDELIKIITHYVEHFDCSVLLKTSGEESSIFTNSDYLKR